MSRKEFDQFIDKLCVIRQGIALDCYKPGYNFHEAFGFEISQGSIKQLMVIVGNVMGTFSHLKPVHIIGMLDTVAVLLPFVVWQRDKMNNEYCEYRGPRVRWVRGKVIGRDQ